MKIAIYGDSFGNTRLENLPNDTRGQGWPEWLAQTYQVTNFASAGSSLFYSYKLFLENNKNFDYNIFLVTEPNRITLPEESIIPGSNMKPHINLKLIDFFKGELKDKNQTLISAIDLYYRLIHNQETVDTFHNLMIDNITRINQNTISIPCFKYSMTNAEISLQCISEYEYADSDIMSTLWKNRYYVWMPIEDENSKWDICR